MRFSTLDSRCSFPEILGHADALACADSVALVGVRPSGGSYRFGVCRTSIGRQKKKDRDNSPHLHLAYVSTSYFFFFSHTLRNKSLRLGPAHSFVWFPQRTCGAGTHNWWLQLYLVPRRDEHPIVLVRSAAQKRWHALHGKPPDVGSPRSKKLSRKECYLRVLN